MSNIERFIKKLIKKDTAVYWGVSDSRTAAGVAVYADPVQINCFWKDKFETVLDDTGEEFLSRASIYLAEDVVQKGILYHGKLTDLTDDQKADQRKVKDAYEVKVFLKTPSLQSGYNRKVMI